MWRFPKPSPAWPASRCHRCSFASRRTSPDIPGSTGIVTERDVMRALARQGSAALALPVGHVCQPSARNRAGRCVRVSRHRPYEPASHPASRRRRWRRAHRRRAFRARPLARSRGARRSRSATKSTQAEDVPSLGRAWAKLPHVAAALLAEGLAGREIAAVISDELGALTARAAVIAERRMAERGQGPPPCPLRVCGVGLCRPRREPARHGPGQRPGVFRG